MKLTKTLLNAVFAVGVTAVSGSAATSTVLQAGTFTQDSGDGFAKFDVSVGDTFTLAAVYDSTARPFPTIQTSVLHQPNEITLRIVGDVMSLANQGQVAVSNNFECCTIPATIFDALGVSLFSAGGFDIAGGTWTDVAANSFISKSQFNSTDLPVALSAVTPITVGLSGSVFQLEARSTLDPVVLQANVEQVSIVAGDASPEVPAIPSPARELLLLSEITGHAGPVLRKKRAVSRSAVKTISRKTERAEGLAQKQKPML